MERAFEQMDRWYRQPLGSAVLELERAQVSRLLSKIHGDYLLQIGGPVSMTHCDSSAIPYRFRASAEFSTLGHSPCVQVDPIEWPIMPNGVDVVLLPHVLEFSRDPLALLSEAYEALAPGGQLIIFGFNPYSLWGLGKWSNIQRGVPWKGRFWSRARVKHWLRKLGYKIVVSKTLCFRWPSSSPGVYQLTDIPEVMGQLCWPGCGGIYFMTAQKKVYQPLVQKTDWWGKRLPIRNRMAEPITRV